MTAPRSLMRQYGLNPKRSLGQNFLVDENYLDRIVEAAELTQADAVLEIGPGLGGLTQRLVAQAGRVVAVEIDERLIDLLRTRFADRPHFSVVQADILQVQPAAFFAEDSGPYKVVANLPYYITSAVLRHLLEASQPPRSAVVMVQKEVAERICAAPGNLSLLAVSVQFYAAPKIVQHVPAGAFYPRPKVDSAVLHLTVYPQPLLHDVSPALFFRIVKAGFSQKRKQLLNSLSAGLTIPKASIVALLQQALIDPRRRPETLSLDEWGLLYKVLKAHLTS